jgi:hypothetical protein
MKFFSKVTAQEQAVAIAKKEISRKFLGNGEVTSVGSRENEKGERYVAVGYLSEITDEIPSNYSIRCEETGKEFLVPVIKMIEGQAIAQTASPSKS